MPQPEAVDDRLVNGRFTFDDLCMFLSKCSLVNKCAFSLYTQPELVFGHKRCLNTFDTIKFELKLLFAFFYCSYFNSCRWRKLIIIVT